MTLLILRESNWILDCDIWKFICENLIRLKFLCLSQGLVQLSVCNVCLVYKSKLTYASTKHPSTHTEDKMDKCKEMLYLLLPPCQSGLYSATSGNSWASTRQPPRAGPSTCRNTALSLLAMVWALVIPSVHWWNMACGIPSSDFIQPQSKPGPQFTVLLMPSVHVLCLLNKWRNDTGQ